MMARNREIFTLPRPGIGALSPFGLLLGMLLIAGQAGCYPDTRISIGEFLKMQERGEFPVATTQPVTTQPTTQPASLALKPWAPGPYRVGPGDTIGITLVGLEKVGLPGTFSLRIREKGEVTLPTVGTITLGGLTLDDLEKKVHSAYVPKYIKETQVTAEIVSYRPVHVIVLGEVLTPATVELRRDRSSIVQAILAAGGPTEEADGLVTLVPSRSPDHPFSIDLMQREQLTQAAQAGVVQDSDVVIVERRSNDAIYVQGLVNAPGVIPVPKGSTISVLQAIGAAGGTLLAFEPKEATLMRRKADGELIRVRLDLHRMLAGKDPDLALAAGDVLSVPHTFMTRLEEYAAANLTLRAGVDYEAIRFEQTRRAIGSTSSVRRGGGGFGNNLASQLALPSILPTAVPVVP